MVHDGKEGRKEEATQDLQESLIIEVLEAQ